MPCHNCASRARVLRPPRRCQTSALPDERAAHVKRLRREAVDTLVAHGLEDHAAELACHLIAKGLVPALKFEMPA